MPATKVKELNETERKILEFVAFRIDSVGFQPSIREIGKQMGWKSPNAVMSRLRSMQEKGVILGRRKMSSRALLFRWKEYLR